MVLVIDDDPAVGPLVRGLLRAGGEAALDVHAEYTLKGGISALPASDLCVVLLDLRLPDVDGLETIRLLRRVLSTDVPVIAITADGDRDLALAALRDGADDFLLKTELSAATLARTIRYAIERASFRRSRREAEAAIRATLDRLDVAVKAGRLGVWEYDPMAGIFGCSAEHAALMGLDAADAAVPFDTLAARVHPDDREVFARVRLGEVDSDVVERNEFRVLLPDGRVRFVEVHWRPITPSELDEHGCAPRIAGVSADVTERFLSSEREIQSQRMQAIGEVAAGIAHDLGNMLLLGTAAIREFDEEPLSARAAEARDNLRLANEQARELVSSLLALAKPGRNAEKESDAIELGTVAETFVRFLRCVVPARIRVTVDRGTAPAFVMLSSTHLRQVLMNLILNARDAILADGDEDGHIEVRVRAATVPNGLHVIEVLDNGPGISADALRTIFEPFVRARPGSSGVGLGLAIVRSIVLGARGCVELGNRPEGGTVARVVLPAVSPREVPASHGAPDAPTSDDVATQEPRPVVALVEPRDYVRRVIADGLAEGGLDVREFHTIGDIVHALEGGLRPDALVLHHAPPMSDADAAITAARRVGCASPSIVISGASDGAPASASSVLHTPFSVIELLRVVRGLLVSGAIS
jgi:two-component system cell cycle sensor histidine kinase/response regulator CckA